MLSSSTPRGILEFVLKAPRWLYRLHLGWLLGHRFLLLTHRGRRSGRLYMTVLEVVHYDPETGESVVVSGWGDRSDWYQNLQESPALAIETGGKRYVPVQRFLTPGETYLELRGYQRRNRWAAGIVRRRFGLTTGGLLASLLGLATVAEASAAKRKRKKCKKNEKRCRKKCVKGNCCAGRRCGEECECRRTVADPTFCAALNVKVACIQCTSDADCDAPRRCVKDDFCGLDATAICRPPCDVLL